MVQREVYVVYEVGLVNSVSAAEGTNVALRVASFEQSSGVSKSTFFFSSATREAINPS